VAKPPESTKTSLSQRLNSRARDRWPALAKVTVRFRAQFAYVDGQLADGDVLPLCRLRYGGSASVWGFAIYLASKDGYTHLTLLRCVRVSLLTQLTRRQSHACWEH
jgi:hypothetical protein